jgi:DNA-binding GntR family transcriptional regulator
VTGSASMPVDGELVSSSLVDLAVSRLQDDILGGVLVPGERIVEEQLTRRFGTSRAPLREALRLLGQRGLVEHLPRRGVRVARLSDTDYSELFDLRQLLEAFAVRTALGRAEPLDLSGLDAAIATMADAAAVGDAPRAAEAHRRFHLAVIDLAGHRQLRLAYEPVMIKLQLYMAANLHIEAQQATPVEGVRRHQRLRDALAGGDVEVALHALDTHGARAFFP